MRTGRWVRGALLGIALAACLPGSPAVSLGEAGSFLARIVDLARAGDFEGLCLLAGDGNCRRHLEAAGLDAVPVDPPRVVATRTIRSGVADEASAGGLVLVMCGRDARGDPYRSEMLVFRDGTSLRAINPVYWGNARIATDGRTVGAPDGPTAC